MDQVIQGSKTLFEFFQGYLAKKYKPNQVLHSSTPKPRSNDPSYATSSSKIDELHYPLCTNFKTSSPINLSCSWHEPQKLPNMSSFTIYTCYLLFSKQALKVFECTHYEQSNNSPFVQLI